MDIKNLSITGLYLNAIYAASVYRDKYACIVLSFDNELSLTFSTNELDIDGGEIYEIDVSENFDKELSTLKEICSPKQKVQMQGIIRRDEWYEKTIDHDSIGENPRSLNFQKPGSISKNSSSIKTVSCGYIIKTEKSDILIVTADYPACLEITTDRCEINEYLKTAEVSYTNNIDFT